MLESTNVVYSGPVFSFLALNGFVTADSEGYMIGRVMVSNHTKISDSSTQQVEVHRTISVTQFVPARVIDAVCANGKFDFEYVDQFRTTHGFGEPQLKVVGWYRSRRNTSLTPSFREQITHRRLLDARAKQRNTSSNQEPFVFSLFVHVKSHINAQHAFDYSAFILQTPRSNSRFFMRSTEQILSVVDSRVANLGDAPQSAYKSTSEFSTALPVELPAHFNESSVNTSYITAVHDAAQSSLANLCAEITQATLKRFDLRNEVRKLEEERFALQQQSFSSSNSEERDEQGLNTASNVDAINVSDNSGGLQAQSEPSKRDSFNLISFGDEAEGNAAQTICLNDNDWVNVPPAAAVLQPSISMPGIAASPDATSPPPSYSLLDEDIENNFQHVQLRDTVDPVLGDATSASASPPPYWVSQSSSVRANPTNAPDGNNTTNAASQFDTWHNLAAVNTQPLNSPVAFADTYQTTHR